MKFFDSLIESFYGLITPLEKKTFGICKEWKDIGSNQVILQRETAFELDGVGFNLITSEKIDDGIVVVGDELDSINSGRRFARVSVIQSDGAEDEQKIYNLIKKIEYVKYHHFPDGYMIRTASRSHKETVRVSKTAVKNGISFQKIGSLLIKKHKENPAVKAVKVIFITDPGAPFDKIEELAQKNTAVAETLNHVMNNINFDCDTCNLKSICDEVEGMRELHFSNAAHK